MKTIFISLAMLLVGTAQAQINVEEKTESFANGSQNAIVVNVPFGKEAIVLKELKAEMKNWGKVKGKSELSVIQGEVKGLDKKLFDAYAKVITGGNGDIKVALAVNLGGAYMNSKEHNVQYAVFVERMRAFAIKAAKECVGAEEEIQNKAVKVAEKATAAAEKEKVGMQKDIEDYKKKIADTESKIKKTEDDIKEKEKVAITQKQKLAEIKEKLGNIK